MFTSFTSHEVSTLIHALHLAQNKEHDPRRKASIIELRDRLQAELTKHELTPADKKLALSGVMREVAIDRGLPMRDVELEPVDLKECEGRILPDVEPAAPPTEPNLGAQYHLLRFLDALRASPEGKVLAPATNAELCEFMSGAMMTLINVDAADDAITDFLGVTFRKIQIELERE